MKGTITIVYQDNSIETHSVDTNKAFSTLSDTGALMFFSNTENNWVIISPANVKKIISSEIFI